ncbi:putative ubiquitin carrier protein [Cucumis melo var. makuwa]|uniref:Putative ubiquitin carrier protein n=1 Tax=Cucumis melo var. makuwa TaxID=1194695 RepID=A0A5D3DXV9_CUCMM|nr:putative ubiquitin carrier protein [Cucumis melo var. makuwa]
MDSLESNRTWHLVDLPPGCKAIDCKWVLRKKLKPDGSVDKYKTRLVAKGFRQRENIDFFDTFFSVTRITSIRVLISIAALNNLLIHQMDVKTTFLNGDLEEEIYMEQSEGFIVHGLNPNVKLFKNTDDSVNQTEYASIIGSLRYAADCTRPDIVYAVGLLCRITSRPSLEHWNAIERVMRYLKKTQNLGLHYNKFPAVLEGYNDADWNSLSDYSKATSGYIFNIAGGAVAWKSKK